MSRGYRLKLRESLSQIVRGSDSIRFQLDILQIHDPDTMKQFLAHELRQGGFIQSESAPGMWIQTTDARHVSISLDTGEVELRVELSHAVNLTRKRTVRVHRNDDPVLEAERQILRREMQHVAEQQSAALQQQATEELEQACGEIRSEMDQVVHRVMVAALKAKAAMLGQIESISEDPAAGSLTIVVQV